MVWPAQSPDLNPIENLWSIVDRIAKNRRVQNEKELFEVIEYTWKTLAPDLLQRLVGTMKRRCEAVIAAKGYATKY